MSIPLKSLFQHPAREIGFSFGGSCLVFTASHRDLGRTPTRQHIAIDPFSDSVWDDCGLLSIERAGLTNYLDFRSAFSSAELPKLISDGARFDLVYVDGSHLVRGCLCRRILRGASVEGRSRRSIRRQHRPARSQGVAISASQLPASTRRIRSSSISRRRRTKPPLSWSSIVGESADDRFPPSRKNRPSLGCTFPVLLIVR